MENAKKIPGIRVPGCLGTSTSTWWMAQHKLPPMDKPRFRLSGSFPTANHNPPTFLTWPPPALYLRHILPMRGDVLHMLDQLIAGKLFEMGGG